MKWIVFGLLWALLGSVIYIRMKRIKPEVWHDTKLPVMKPGEYPKDSGIVVQRPLEGDGLATLAALDEIIRATPRTHAIAGQVAEGKITYVTRSRVVGFPDFTTVTLAQLPATQTSSLQIFGRLQFGQKDFGVNAARVKGWLAQLDATR
ncbi:DUF1499 domain-containing protein [Octadecabacter sp. 1_MG-2023]|uniref:DUF1499 domain-containing protein n=1 Tax=unclassified Octadecabacter TaxID=196158 RepID=UPI001C07F8C5|nr:MULTISPECIES: DUF1499 domain-containing protein [unclassified Octadecabacter]MBU2993602.1 DUF1499 domain-containing protein [Octadecabacter sp. B2R22]MDO6735554.1 DUF1499 domain-containing protein [Octadecabacter sp. 1_MG-2023]